MPSALCRLQLDWRDRGAERREPRADGSAAAGRLAAGFGLATAAGGVERLAAGAVLDGIRVLDGKSAAHQRVDVVDLRAFEVLETEGIDHDFDASVIEGRIVVGPIVVERHPVGEAGAAARRDVDPQRGAVVALFLDDLLELADRAL